MIADVLKRRRRELGKKASLIAKEVGVSESTYRDWENGRKIQGEPYKQLAAALDINILHLLEIEQADTNIVLSALDEIEKHVNVLRKIVM